MQRHYHTPSAQQGFSLRARARATVPSDATTFPCRAFVALLTATIFLISASLIRAETDASAETEAPQAVPDQRELLPDDGTVWQAVREWDLEEEKRYAEWVRNNIDPGFFRRHNMITDCADVPYAVRCIYARIRGLPQGFHSGWGAVIGNWTHHFENLPRHKDWAKDQRFRAALRHVTLDFTRARDLPGDTYPVKIWPEDEMVRPGTVFVNSKHSGIVYTVDPASFFPIKVAYSTLPPKVRDLITINYERN